MRSNPVIIENIQKVRALSLITRKLSRYSVDHKKVAVLKNKYKFIFDEIFKDNYLGMAYALIRLSKKIILPFIIVFNSNDSFKTFISMIIFYGVGFFFILIAEPYRKKIFNILAMVSELLIILCLTLLAFYDLSISKKNPSIAFEFGFLIIYSFCGVLLLYFALMIALVILIIVRKILDRRNKLKKSLKINEKKPETKNIEGEEKQISNASSKEASPITQQIFQPNNDLLNNEQSKSIPLEESKKQQKIFENVFNVRYLDDEESKRDHEYNSHRSKIHEKEEEEKKRKLRQEEELNFNLKKIFDLECELALLGFLKEDHKVRNLFAEKDNIKE